jgi:FkbM family methyltransferase
MVQALERLAPRLLFKYRVVKYSACEAEQRLIPFLCDKQHIGIDVGANIGIYSGLIVKHAQACHAFEANPALARLLQRAQVPGLTVTNAAVSDRSGQVTLYVPRQIHGLASVEVANPGLKGGNIGPLDAVQVPAVRLDEITFAPVSLIKIDVEGHEESVLKGAVNTLNQHRPSLIIENDNRHNPGVVGRVQALLSGLGYSGYFLQDGKLRSVEEFDAQREQDPHALARRGFAVYVSNFLFFPAESATKLASRCAAAI